MMHTRSTIFSRHARHAFSALALGLGLGLGAPAAFAASAGPVTEADIESRYRLDVERCNTGQTNQDKPTCMREAGAARDEARRNRLTNANESYRQNETARCQALPIGERDECMLQMSGQNTTTQGSVGAGGVLRETTIEVPGTPTPAPAPGLVPGTTSPVPPALPAPGLTPNPPPVVPAPSLAPTAPATPAAPVSPATPVAPMSPATPVSPTAPAATPAPGTGVMK